MKDLLIVESPAKATTISSYLGGQYDVVASFGHIRDLPKSRLGVDVDHNYEPEYIIPKKNAKHVASLKKLAKGRETIWLATDLDREGEAIAWHVQKVLESAAPKKAVFKRITFHEITKPAIIAAVAEPRSLNDHLIDAQQARRILDRLVGYTLSPLLWKKLYKGLSAGRVQSAALKMIVDRERERTAFKPEEYWTLDATLAAKKQSFVASYIGVKGSKTKDKPLRTEKDVTKVKEAVDGAKWVVDALEEKEEKRHPRPPFITSTLQQAASNRLGMSAKRTMAAAQRLYEAGYITYMRTDSVVLSSGAIREIRAVIQKEYGDDSVPDKANMYKGRKSAQEAHEAIRPTHVRTRPETVSGAVGKDEARVYELIWRRAVASQMVPAVVKKVTCDVVANKQLFRANGLIMLFPGHLAAIGTEAKETVLPPLKVGDAVTLASLDEAQHFTEPPARYTEASLIKVLEEAGIGRPSTYAPTIATLYARNYVVPEGKALVPQEVGFQVIDLLAEHFPDIVDAGFTAEMEEEFDRIADGKEKWQPMIDDFFKPFAKAVKQKEKSVEKVVTDTPLDEKCPECGKPLVLKNGRFGQFKACTGFPDCKYTAAVTAAIDVPCAICGKPLAARRTKRGKTFYGCTGYPKCTFALWDLKLPTFERKMKELADAGTKAPHASETEAAIKQQHT